MSLRKTIRRSLFRIDPRLGGRAAKLWDDLSPLWGGRLGIRRAAKYLMLGVCPGVPGRFSYYETRVYFPKGSVSFRRACEEGIYEAEVTNWLCRLTRPNTTFVDVGANIGLSTIPVLRTVNTAQVVAFEPSPSSLPYLWRTWLECDFKERWEIIPKAASESVGETEFWTAAENYAAFDGLLDTNRGGAKHAVKVPQTTLDVEWDRLGRPSVSLIKIDVEGAESRVLDGAGALIRRDRPHILLEWNRDNLKPYGTNVSWLLEYANCSDYDIVALPNVSHVTSIHDLELHMLQTESYLLAPKSG